MALFLALPVRAGDSFFLDRGGRSVLVDGGKSVVGLPLLFTHHLNRDGVDILVCTHNDADHANGIIGFLEAGLRCREVWLPGAWLGVLDALSSQPEETIDDIVRGAVEHRIGRDSEWDDRPNSLEEVGNSLLHEGSEHDGSYDEDPLTRVEASLEKAASLGAPYTDLFAWDSWWWSHIPRSGRPLRDPGSFWKVVREAIDAAERIRAIAALAFERGVPVRWFSHERQNAGGGIAGFLEPVGAREVVRIFPYHPLFARLALTTVNRTALVLYSPADGSSPGVMFSADSDLRGMRLPVRRKDLITAPHHGAEANAHAYAQIAGAPGLQPSTAPESVTWVRSDCHSRQRPGNTFRHAPGRKYCTVCSNGIVKLVGRRGAWARGTGLDECGC